MATIEAKFVSPACVPWESRKFTLPCSSTTRSRQAFVKKRIFFVVCESEALDAAVLPSVSPSPPSNGAVSAIHRGMGSRAPISEVKKTADKVSFEVPHLLDFLPDLKSLPSPLDASVFGSSATAPSTYRGYFVMDNTSISYDVTNAPDRPRDERTLIRAGPRKNVYFEPSEVKAAVVSCGGLCPGMNVVIREIVMCLWKNYRVRNIIGIREGYRGFYRDDLVPTALTPEYVVNIHTLGGTVLGSSRGGFDGEKITNMLEREGVNQVYIIGGDGTHRGANQVYQEVRRRKLKISVVGIPKTIDNDIPFIDQSFGFDTAVEQACKAIDSAWIEARCFPNGVGIVNLMGRSSGFIAMHATLASRVVDACLIPEVPFALEGDHGLLAYVENCLKEKRSCLIVVAEGAGQDMLPPTGAVDKSGNPKLAEVGKFLLDSIRGHLSQKTNDFSMKYLDPTYMVRSVPANPSDSIYCTILAQSAVHGAFAGYTGFSSGRVNGRYVYLPMSAIAAGSATVDPNSRMWFRLKSSTMQPDFIDIESPLLDEPVGDD